jgi:hypothetical protein
MKKHCEKLLLIIFFVGLLLSCATLPQTSSWIMLQEDVFTSSFVFENSLVHLLKADLKNDKIFLDLQLYNKKENEKNVLAKINAGPFIKKANKTESVGIIYYKKELISSANEKYDMLLCLENKELKIMSQKEKFDKDVFFAVGGFWQILKDGEFIKFADIKDSRSAIGYDEKNKIVIFLQVEGEKFSASKGLSYEQCAKLFKELGCQNAIQMDGGSSSALFLKLNLKIFKKNF